MAVDREDRVYVRFGVLIFGSLSVVRLTPVKSNASRLVWCYSSWDEVNFVGVFSRLLLLEAIIVRTVGTISDDDDVHRYFD